jgi:hypothetical protein
MKTLALTLTASLGLLTAGIATTASAADSTMVERDRQIVLVCKGGDPLICRHQDPNAMMESNPTAAGRPGLLSRMRLAEPERFEND